MMRRRAYLRPKPRKHELGRGKARSEAETWEREQRGIDKRPLNHATTTRSRHARSLASRSTFSHRVLAKRALLYEDTPAHNATSWAAY